MRAGAKLEAEGRIFRSCIRAGNIRTDGRQMTRTRIYRREGLDKRALAAAIFADKNRHTWGDLESAFADEVLRRHLERDKFEVLVLSQSRRRLKALRYLACRVVLNERRGKSLHRAQRLAQIMRD